MEVDLNTQVEISKESIVLLTLAILIAGTGLMLISKFTKK